jgi:hypothetical protein
MNKPHRFVWTVLILTGACFTADLLMAQSLEPSNDPSPGMRQLPPIPGGGPDPLSKYKIDSDDLRALRMQARLEADLRQKQLTEATDLLLKVTRELRADLAAHPNGTSKAIEMERLKLILKLSHLIQEREKAEDPVATKLAKAGLLE